MDDVALIWTSPCLPCVSQRWVVGMTRDRDGCRRQGRGRQAGRAAFTARLGNRRGFFCRLDGVAASEPVQNWSRPVGHARSAGTSMGRSEPPFNQSHVFNGLRRRLESLRFLQPDIRRRLPVSADVHRNPEATTVILRSAPAPIRQSPLASTAQNISGRPNRRPPGGFASALRGSWTGQGPRALDGDNPARLRGHLDTMLPKKLKVPGARPQTRCSAEQLRLTGSRAGNQDLHSDFIE